MIQFLLFAALVFGISSGLFWLWKRPVERDIAEGAQTAFQNLSEKDPDLMEGLNETNFAVIYRRTHYPRFPAYALIAFGIFLAGTPIALAILSAIAHLASTVGIIPQPGDAATELYLGSGETSVVRKFNPETLSYILQGWAGFYYFFGLLGFWLGTVYFVMKRYHLRAPGTLREEILRAR